MRRLTLLPTAALLVSTACAPPAPPPPPAVDLTAEENAIRDRDARWMKAAQARDAAGEAALFASDGVGYPGNMEPVVGPAAYEAFAAKRYEDNPKSSITWSTDAIQVAASGDLAVQTGQFHVTGLGPEGTREDRGRFVTVWKKVNGEWKVAHDIGSSTTPAAPPNP